MSKKSIAFLIVFTLAACAFAADDYKPGPDSTTQPSVPHGEALKFTFDKSKVFPGTTRDVSIYVPAQYTADKPACVFVRQDGIGWEAVNVFDNLIAKKEMPVTIGVFITPGKIKALDETSALDRFNRSYEYDGLGENYARFLLDELLPEVETMKTSDGRAIKLSHDANDRAIGGSSSGAICAFTVAWEHPEAFSRVFTSIGTFVGLRGGDRYPTLIRKTEPKAIRVFLQDGSNDNNAYGGDWWMANQMMERALIFAGYEVDHAWGDGGHTGKQATAIFPDAMRFLWKDWPTPVKKGKSKNQMMNDILDPESQWGQVAGEFKELDALAADANGDIWVSDLRAQKLFFIEANGRSSSEFGPTKSSALCLGPAGDGTYSIHRDDKTVVRDEKDVIADRLTSPNDLVMAHNGNLYVTDDPAKGTNDPGVVWLIKPDGSKSVVDDALKFPNGVTLSPDQSLLYVSDYRSHWVYSFQIQPDGTLADGQKYDWLHAPDTADDAGGDGMCVDVDGRLYVSTRMGVQVCDQAGRVNCILPTPNGRVSALTFGGEKFDTLFAACGDKLYKRKMNVKGNPAWAEAHKPAPPRL